MKRRPTLFVHILAYLSLYPFLILSLVITALACTLIFNIVPRLMPSIDNTAVQQRIAVLPSLSSPDIITPINDNVATENSAIPGPQSEQYPIKVDGVVPASDEIKPAIDSVSIAEAAQPPVSVVNVSPETITDVEPATVEDNNTTIPVKGPSPTPTLALDFSNFANQAVATPTRTRRSTLTPESIIAELVENIMSVIGGVDESAVASRAGTLPTLTPTPTSSPTLPPTNTPTPTETAVPTSTPLPTNTLIPTETPLPTNTPAPTSTPLPTNTPVPTTVPLPTDTPVPTLTPLPEYDYLLGEFFNSRTTNSFLVMYVAIVDPNEVPVGDMKIVGTRLDHNLTYESPLSTWHYEGYNAPSNVIKSGNVKFEPPGGIEDVSWIFHLEDANSNRMSPDIPFHTSQDDKQWYFVKFKRKF